MKYAIGVLLLVGCCVAQTRIIQLTGHKSGCLSQANELAAVVKRVNERPQKWLVYAVCTTEEFKQLKRKADLPDKVGAFTDLKTHTTWVDVGVGNNPDTQDRDGQFLRLMEHEVKHMNCNCDLGERR
jgi:hypothetical protein